MTPYRVDVRRPDGWHTLTVRAASPEMATSYALRSTHDALEARQAVVAESSAPAPQNDPPNAHTATQPVGADDLSVRWGTTEATIEWGPPKPGTHERDLDYLGPCFVHGAVYLHCKTTGCAARGSAHEFDAAARWSRENAR